MRLAQVKAARMCIVIETGNQDRETALLSDRNY